MVTIQNLCVNYGDNVVYQNFNFVFPKAVNVILGKSGCGKTTLLKAIAGLVAHSGQCQFEGNCAMVFQSPCLAPTTVINNVRMVCDDAQRVQQALQLAEIANKANCRAHNLSGGEQQRVSLARMFAAGGQVMLLDEPFSNLDYGTKASLRHTLLRLVADKTVLFVTHDVEDAIAVADNIYLLQGSPCTLQQLPCPQGQAAQRNLFSPHNNQLRNTLHNALCGN